MSLLDELRGLAKVGVRPGGIDDGVNLTLADDGTGVDSAAGLRGDWQRFASQGGLIHLDRVAVEQTRIRGNDVTQTETDYVAGYHLARLGILPLAIPLDFGLDRQTGFQGGNGIPRLVFFPESNQSVGAQQQKNHEEIEPVTDKAGEDHGSFNHPWNGAPEIGKKLQVFVGLLFLDLVRPILRLTLHDLGLCESVSRCAELLHQLRHGERFQGILLIIGLWFTGLRFHSRKCSCSCSAERIAGRAAKQLPNPAIRPGIQAPEAKVRTPDYCSS